jgi:hypothetical protein
MVGRLERLLLALVAARTRGFDVRLAFTRRVRGAVYPVQTNEQACSNVTYRDQPCDCFGGAARRLGALREDGSAITIDTGEHFAGSGLFFPVFHGNASAHFFAHVGVRQA